LAFSPDSSRLASGAIDGTVKLWNSETGDELLSLKGHTDRVWNVAFSPNGRQLASAGGGVAKIWDISTGQEALSLVGGFGRGIAFSPDGRRLAGGGMDNTVKIWDVTPLLEKP
jgi:WD40 repeat protein